MATMGPSRHHGANTDDHSNSAGEQSPVRTVTVSFAEAVTNFDPLILRSRGNLSNFTQVNDHTFTFTFTRTAPVPPRWM
jgi:hypothetical protein